MCGKKLISMDVSKVEKLLQAESVVPAERGIGEHTIKNYVYLERDDIFTYENYTVRKVEVINDAHNSEYSSERVSMIFSVTDVDKEEHTYWKVSGYYYSSGGYEYKWNHITEVQKVPKIIYEWK